MPGNNYLRKIPLGSMEHAIKARARVAAGPMEVHALLGELRDFLANGANVSSGGSARAWDLCQIVDATKADLGDAYALGTRAAEVRHALRLSLREMMQYARTVNRYFDLDANTRALAVRAQAALDAARDQVREVRRDD